MTTDDTARAARLRNAFDTVEEAYEFMLAYAAQGRKSEAGDGGGESQIRNFLKRFAAALDDVLDALPEPGPGSGASDAALGGPAGKDFVHRFRADAAAARSVVGLLLDRPNITSAMVDNSNGLIAMRAFLTDIFFVDQVVLPAR